MQSRRPHGKLLFRQTLCDLCILLGFASLIGTPNCTAAPITVEIPVVDGDVAFTTNRLKYFVSADVAGRKLIALPTATNDGFADNRESMEHPVGVAGNALGKSAFAAATDSHSSSSFEPPGSERGNVATHFGPATLNTFNSLMFSTATLIAGKRVDLVALFLGIR